MNDFITTVATRAGLDSGGSTSALNAAGMGGLTGNLGGWF